MILIGSAAIKYFYKDFPREPKDIDVIRQFKEITPIDLIEQNLGKKVEIHENKILENYPNSVLDPDTLLTLKASHLCWNINWEKHLYDVQFLLKKDHKIDKELFFKLYDYWNTIHSKNKRSDLKMSKEDFFTNAINYNVAEHDELHKLINPNPVYLQVLKDNCEVELDENKFHNLVIEDKLNFVREEVMVMAFERYRNYLAYKQAYNTMLKKFIISHAPIWTIIFIIENYIELVKCKVNYYKIIENGLNKN